MNGDGRKLGQRFRAARLAGLTDLDSALPGTYALELCGRIVEEYSMTAITNEGDKLIAISGVARRMAPAMKLTGALANMPEYFAGLWTLHIASQLLWFVEPDFLESTGEKNGIFSNRSTAPAKGFYRAPSFSWAAVDANEMRGIKYAETTDKDLLIEVVDTSATAKHGSDIFGILKDARLTIRGKLRRARIDGPNEKGRYRWHLVDREGLNEEQHRKVYLDCPQRDGKITGHDANIFVVPAARGSRLAPQGSKYMICLLLQLVLEGEDGRKKAFRRVGLTKLSPWADSKALEGVDDLKGGRMARILIPKARDNDMPHVRGYNAKDGTHEILLV